MNDTKHAKIRAESRRVRAAIEEALAASEEIVDLEVELVVQPEREPPRPGNLDWIEDAA